MVIVKDSIKNKKKEICHLLLHYDRVYFDVSNEVIAKELSEIHPTYIPFEKHTDSIQSINLSEFNTHT